MSYTIGDFARDHDITPEENAQAVAQLRRNIRLYELHAARKASGPTQANRPNAWASICTRRDRHKPSQ